MKALAGRNRGSKGKRFREGILPGPPGVSQTHLLYIHKQPYTVVFLPQTHPALLHQQFSECPSSQYPTHSGVTGHLLSRACSDISRRNQVTSFSVIPPNLMPPLTLTHITSCSRLHLWVSFPTPEKGKPFEKYQCLPSPCFLRDEAPEDDPVLIYKAPE